MRKTLLNAILIVLAVPALPKLAAAQADADASAEVERWLRQLVNAQESYYVDHGTYTTDLAALDLLSAARQDSVWITVVQAGGRYWTATAGHRSARGKTCAIYVGLTDEIPAMPKTSDAELSPKQEAVPVCDDF